MSEKKKLRKRRVFYVVQLNAKVVEYAVWYKMIKIILVFARNEAETHLRVECVAKQENERHMVSIKVHNKCRFKVVIVKPNDSVQKMKTKKKSTLKGLTFFLSNLSTWMCTFVIRSKKLLFINSTFATTLYSISYNLQQQPATTSHAQQIFLFHFFLLPFDCM